MDNYLIEIYTIFKEKIYQICQTDIDLLIFILE